MEWMYVWTALVAIILSYFLLNHRKRIRLPGPRGWPIFGNAIQAKGSKRHQALLKWSETFGPVYQISLYGKPCVVVSDPAVAKQALEELPKSRKFYRMIDEMLHPKALPSMVTSPLSSSAHWRAVRKCVLHAFSRAETIEDFEVAKSKALLLAERLASRGSGVVVDMADMCMRLSLDVMGLSKLGYDFEAVESSGRLLILQLLRECSQEWCARQVNPLRSWFWWALDAWGDGRKRYQVLQAFVGELLADIRKRGPPPEEDTTLAAQLVRLRDPLTARPVGDEVLLAEVGGFLAAGTESMGAALAWCLYCLAANTTVQDKLVAELKAQGVTTAPHRLSYESLANLPYLDCVVREVLRLYPTGGEGSMREVVAREGASLGGHKLPAGTTVWVHTYSLHRSSKLWEEPNRFNPERWESSATSVSAMPYDGFRTASDLVEGPGEGGAEASSEAKGSKQKGKMSKEGQSLQEDTGATLCQRTAFMPFSTGPRACIGQALAQAVVKVALAMLLCRLKLELAAEPGAEGPYAEHATTSISTKSGTLPLTISIRRN